MKVTRTWLQNYFEAPLPSAAELADTLTFHAFEIEEVVGDMLDVKVLPNRAADSLSHRGIARELSAILGVPFKSDPLHPANPEKGDTFSVAEKVSPFSLGTVEVQIASTKVRRYSAALLRGVKVGPSPEWLKSALESVGQRSINNVVDATNFVMLDLGQPLHAFDAAKLSDMDGVYKIGVRGSKENEKITTLTGEEYALPPGTLLITDAASDAAIGIAGIKGGKAAEITEATTDIILESASFDATAVRKSAQALKLFTDASTRYQNNPSAELVGYGMKAILDLIVKVAGGEVVGGVDVYPTKEVTGPVSVSLAQVNGRLGSSFTPEEVKSVFDRFGFSYTQEGEAFTVTPPFERRDLVIAEDLVEEVAQILGFERIADAQLPPLTTAPDQAIFRGISRIKDAFTELGYSEVSTQSFATTGEVILANPLDNTKPALRPDLTENMQDALKRGASSAPRLLGPADKLKLFEIGTVFMKDAEKLSLALGYTQLIGKASPAVLAEALDALTNVLGAIPDNAIKAGGEVVEVDLTNFDLAGAGQSYAPRAVTLGAYRPFSIYPFALRDVAVWTPLGTEQSEVEEIILKEAGELLARLDLFDRFEKEDRLSFGFRLVFEAFDRTLTDVELTEAMSRIAGALNSQAGFTVR